MFLPIPDKIAKKKSKDVVWLVGNCKTQSKREAYVRKLKVHGIKTGITWKG